MKFQIQRTGVYDAEPHPKAHREDVLRVDVRTCKTFEEYDQKHGKLGNMWLDEGSNHRQTDDGCIARDFPGKAWTIEINTLEDLLAFSKECGNDLVLSPTHWLAKGMPCIEIYDGYRE